MLVEHIIRFDTDDPDQAAALSIIKQIKRGSKGRLVSKAIMRMLHEHNLGNITFNPDVAAQFLELLLAMSPSAAVTLPVIESDRKTEKDRKKKNKAAALKQVNITSGVIEHRDISPPSSALPLEEKKAEEAIDEEDIFVSQTPDGDYPWRLPDGRMRPLTDEEAMALQDKPELIELYAKEIMDYAAEHPEDAPTL